MTITQKSFTQVDNNTSGNPRYVLHFLALSHLIDSELSVSQKYNEALYIAKKLGGKKYHNKSYGGGIAFVTYNLNDLIQKLNNLTID